MTPPRVGIVGARRVRQGLGPYVARDLVAAGAEVPCFLATSVTSREEARRALRDAARIEPRGYLSLEEMLARESVDALAILSPAETHVRYLEAAAAAGLHVLCEKPLVWGARDLAGDAARVCALFADRELLLVENCQWPYALPAFEALHPGALARPPRRFAMRLEPSTRGLQSLGDALPHPLSVLQALLPGAPRVSNVRFSTRDPESPELLLRFRFETQDAACDAEVRLCQAAGQPRRAELELDGRAARRLVSPEGYRLCFAASERRVPLPDPLTLLVSDFVGALRGGRRGGTDPILQRMQLLAAIAASWSNEEMP